VLPQMEQTDLPGPFEAPLRIPQDHITTYGTYCRRWIAETLFLKAKSQTTEFIVPSYEAHQPATENLDLTMYQGIRQEGRQHFACYGISSCAARPSPMDMRTAVKVSATNVRTRKITVERNDLLEDYTTSSCEVWSWPRRAAMFQYHQSA